MGGGGGGGGTPAVYLNCVTRNISCLGSLKAVYRGPYLAIEGRLNPNKTGVYFSRCLRQWSSWAATKGAYVCFDECVLHKK